MDSLTHIVLGACIGEVMLGKKTGKKAMLLGALAQSIPDIDFIASLWLSPAKNLMIHRGITHSFLFAAAVIVSSALLSKQSKNVSSSNWTWFFAINILAHIFLDSMNAYGVGWFEPFSHYRVTFNLQFVADPLFSIWPGIACIALLILPRHKKGRMKWAKSGLILPALYLVLGSANKLAIDKEIRSIAANENISCKRYFSTPAPFNNFLWYIVVETDSGYYTGYRSVFDRQEISTFKYFPRNEHLLNNIADTVSLRYLLSFSQGDYTVEEWNGSLVFNVLRFEQEVGWTEPRAHFVFHYYLSPGADNKFVLQRGRFENWDANATRSLIKRIGGN